MPLLCRLASVVRISIGGFSLVVILGCTSSSGDSGDGFQIAEPVLPFDQYALSMADDEVIEAAEDAVMEECAAARGVAWDKPDRAAVADPLVKIDGNARRYGLIDGNAARQFGYHVPEEPAEAAFMDQFGRWMDQLTPVEYETFYGDDGCALEVKARLYADVGGPGSGWLSSLDAAAFDSAAQDPGVVEATSAWSVCMAERGHDYDSPEAAVDDGRWDFDSAEASSEEIEVAMADVECKWKSDLVEIRTVAEAGIQNELIDQSAEIFAQLRRAKEALLANAATINNGA